MPRVCCLCGAKFDRVQPLGPHDRPGTMTYHLCVDCALQLKAAAGKAS